ncbi:MAG: secondary thiamine-phosphate synthase enzyme YjbQ [Planctomycetota bacterium]|jgi:secondary thiamine-phosphate synthase enzyme
METFQVQTHGRTELVDITAQVQESAKASGHASGLVMVFVPHTTAGVTINENADPSVVRDILMETEKVIPFEDGYRHGEGNSAAHIKSSLFGPSLTLILEGGRLQLGTWQGVYFCEFDGPRRRKVHVKCVPG